MSDSDAALQQFLHIASHDLGEPIRQVISFTEILQEEEAQHLSEDGLLYLQRANAAGLRLQNMLKGMLQLSRIVSQGQAFIPCDMNTVLANVISILNSDIDHCASSIHQAREMPELEGDEAQLGVLLYQVLKNSLIYTRPGIPAAVKIHSRCDESANRAYITVSDNGRGFEPQQAEIMFNVFGRLDPQEAPDGDGIGLTLCKRICERHGGLISATPNEDTGTIIHIELPLRQTA